MEKEYNYIIRELKAVPRSVLRMGEAVQYLISGSNSLNFSSTSSGNSAVSADGHTHVNKADLDRLGIGTDDAYIRLKRWSVTENGTEGMVEVKASSGFSDEATLAQEAIHANAADRASLADEALHAQGADEWLSRNEWLDQPVRTTDQVVFRGLTVRATDVDASSDRIARALTLEGGDPESLGVDELFEDNALTARMSAAILEIAPTGGTNSDPTTLGGLLNVDETFDTVADGTYAFDMRGGVLYPIEVSNLGGTAGVTLKLRSLSESFLTAIAARELQISYQWSSIYDSDGESTGSGTAMYTVNGAKVATRSVVQGEMKFDAGSYLRTGTNQVSIKLTDSTGLSRLLEYTVEVVQLSVSSNYNRTDVQTGEISFRYIPVGAVEKTIHFLIDSREIAHYTTTRSGQQLTQVLPAQPHGSHLLEVYITATIDEVQVESESICFDLICVEAGNLTPVISSEFRTQSVRQYETMSIPFVVYDPSATVAAVILSVDGKTENTLSVDRTRQQWNYRANLQGEVQLSIACRGTVKTFVVEITESSIQVEAETADLELCLSSQGRHNQELNPAQWNYGEIASELKGFNWSTNGWLADSDGNTCLRIAGGARVYIPWKVFEQDSRAAGKTLEFELSTRDIEDYEAVVVDCYSGGRGIRITAQSALLQSEQSSVTAQFKEEERLRISFVIYEQAEDRLILTYINGVASGSVQYPENDNFAQNPAIGITLGSDRATLDVYNIRIYNNNLTKYQILDNYIADMDDVDKKINLYERNQIYDNYGSIDFAKLRSRISVMTLIGELPQYKGDKKTVSVNYKDLEDSSRSWTASGVELDVQGTSSQYYPRKNYKLKFKKGFLMEESGETVNAFSLHDGVLPAKVFCTKADFAESSGTHNTGLANYVEDVLKSLGLLTPPQQEDNRIRTTVTGYPICITHKAADTAAEEFIGKYNFNTDKGAENTFGFGEGDESWEFCNNTSPRMLFRTSDYAALGTDTNNQPYALWTDDFEARFPDDDDLNDQYAAGTLKPSKLKQVTDWIVSCIGRSDKFKNELSGYMDRDNLIAYYVITLVLGMVDQRAKNMFLTTYRGAPWIFIFYDNDTCCGINNEGKIEFFYDIEIHDIIHDKAVWNGADSELWKLVETAFVPEIQALYARMRQQDLLSYDLLMKYLNTNQSEKWSEAIYNEDGDFKYIKPLTEGYLDYSESKENPQYIKTGSYLYALQGSREMHRKWWLYNRILYLDSKFVAGSFLSDTATFRIYTPANWQGTEPNATITIVPFAAMYVNIKYGSVMRSYRASAGEEVTILPPEGTIFNDTETIIHGASRIKSLCDLSPLYPGTIDVSKMSKLSELVIGSGAENYRNTNLTVLSLGTNKMLKKLDVRNCPNLEQPVDLSGCENIEEVYATGTSLTSITFAAGGTLRELHFPETVRSLTLRNQPNLTHAGFSLAGVQKLTTLSLENVPGLDATALLTDCFAVENSVLERVRLTGIRETNGNVEILFRLSELKGLDANGNTAPSAVLTGSYHVERIDRFTLETYQTLFPELEITYSKLFTPTIFLTFKGLATHPIEEGGFSCQLEKGSFIKITDYVYEVMAPVFSTFVYTFTSSNYASVTGHFTVPEMENDIHSETISLTYIPLRTICVRSEQNYLAGVTVWINGVELPKKTDVYGRVTLRTAETLTVRAGGLEGYSIETATFQSVSEDATHQLVLAQKVEFLFKVLSTTGNYLSGASVTVGTDTMKTDNSGTVLLSLLPGVYTYSVTYKSQSKSGSFTVESTSLTTSVAFEVPLEDEMPDPNGNIQLLVTPNYGTSVRVFSITVNAPSVLQFSWGDGTFSEIETSGSTAEVNHKYEDGIQYHQVEISGCESVTYIEVSKTVAFWSIGKSQITGLDFYYSNSLVTVGSDIFRNDTERTSMQRCFANCTLLRRVPEGLFDPLIHVTTFESVFSTCKVLESVPAGLFAHMTQLSELYNTFKECTALKTIPSGFFATLVNLTSFQSVFSGCTALEQLPEGLFDNLLQINKFDSGFKNCSSLVWAPELWILCGDPDGTNSAISKSSCFYNCTKAVNYSAIPAKWK